MRRRINCIKTAESGKNVFVISRQQKKPGSFVRVSLLHLNPVATYSPTRRPRSTMGAGGLNHIKDESFLRDSGRLRSRPRQFSPLNFPH